jgi:hypothetical protein
VIVPEGVPVAGSSAATVAVSVTGSVATEGFGVATTIVVVDAGTTVGVAVPTLAVKFTSPL